MGTTEVFENSCQFSLNKEVSTRHKICRHGKIRGRGGGGVFSLPYEDLFMKCYGFEAPPSHDMHKIFGRKGFTVRCERKFPFPSIPGNESL